MSTTEAVSIVKMEEIVNLCKRKGFVFQSSEIYSPMSGFFDYGPLGAELKNNIKKLWWRDIVQKREDIVGLDSSIIASPSIWQASGHIAGFSDPMVDCKESKLRFRADQVFWAALKKQDSDEAVCYVSVMESADMLAEATKAVLKKAKSLGISGPFLPLDLRDLTEPVSDEVYASIPSPGTGIAGHLTRPRDFNLMFQTSVGAMADGVSVAYLRPETAQGIFTNFASVQRTARMKIPFGIAQIGKAFRNEITPRNFIFRSREFEQMEIEYFITPDDEAWQKFYLEWIESSWQWLKSIGLREDLMSKCEHAPDKLAHYARACTDILFQFPFGNQELMGIAARGNYDLTQHSTHSGKQLEYFDSVTNSKYIPHVIEPSCGVDRLFLALLVSAYREETVDGEKRTVLGFHPSVAPIKVNVLPLVNNKPEITTMARDIFKKLQQRYMCEFDTSGAIGRRYRRADESGTPFCITVDFESLSDESVTVRFRDSMQQSRMKIEDLYPFLMKNMFDEDPDTRSRVLKVNNNIARCAKRKELTEAFVLYENAVREGIANSHTYAAVINACVRCGCITEAENVISNMTKHGRKRDVIICTTLIKGFCSNGMVWKALQYLTHMMTRSPIVKPNIRTINTILRGCVQSGDVDNAELLLTHNSKDLDWDMSSWEYLVSLLCQALCLNKVLPIIGRLKTGPLSTTTDFPIGMASMQVNLARAAALLCDTKNSKKAATAAVQFLDQDALIQTNGFGDEDCEADQHKQATGGKRSWRSGSGGVDDNRERSLQLFREHRRAELRAEVQQIETFLGALVHSTQHSISSNSEGSGTSLSNRVLPYLLRIISFPPAKKASSDSKPIVESGKDSADLTSKTARKGKSSLTKKKKSSPSSFEWAVNEDDAADAADIAAIMRTTIQRFGLARFLQRSQSTTLEEANTSARSLLSRSFAEENGLLRMTVGRKDDGQDETNTKNAPLKMEICSGAGEWVVAQAGADSSSEWLAMELRHDRAYQTIARAAFAGVGNLTVLCGDAKQILPSRICSDSLAAVFVNHPEPPQQQKGGDGNKQYTSQAAHLLDQEFFLEMQRVLVKSGLLTIVTDNLWYGQLLLRLLTEMVNSEQLQLTSMQDGGTEENWAVQEKVDDICLFVGTPGSTAGHVVEASSYFDRLWKRENLVDRYFLVLKKSRKKKRPHSDRSSEMKIVENKQKDKDKEKKSDKKRKKLDN